MSRGGTMTKQEIVFWAIMMSIVVIFASFAGGMIGYSNLRQALQIPTPSICGGLPVAVDEGWQYECWSGRSESQWPNLVLRGTNGASEFWLFSQLPYQLPCESFYNHRSREIMGHMYHIYVCNPQTNKEEWSPI